MNGIAGSLRLGWRALLLREDAYEEMRTSANPVIKGFVLIILVGVGIALLGLVGNVLEWASSPSVAQIKGVVHNFILQMPGWAQMPAQARAEFERWYDLGWRIFPSLFGAPSVGKAAAGIVLIPLGLVIRWLVYGLLAYLFARWLGGTATLSETLGVLALAVAPQALNAFTLFPYVHLGSLVAVWGILCAYTGLKAAHKLSWSRAIWATLLPFLLGIGVLLLASCMGTAIFAAVVKGG
jgi:hypothetical protein